LTSPTSYTQIWCYKKCLSSHFLTSFYFDPLKGKFSKIL
jgi:hypothetical protein